MVDDVLGGCPGPLQHAAGVGSLDIGASDGEDSAQGRACTFNAGDESEPAAFARSTSTTSRSNDSRGSTPQRDCRQRPSYRTFIAGTTFRAPGATGFVPGGVELTKADAVSKSDRPDAKRGLS
jgi:hypothetical protein